MERSTRERGHPYGREAYIVEDGERIYLDERRHVKRLSAKAQHMQNVLAGIAQVMRD